MRTLIPALRPTRVLRRRLLRRLDGWRNAPLIVISAPAGFGKTTLAGDWISSLLYSAQADRPLCAWLSLGSEDADVNVFLQHVAEALAPLLPNMTQLAVNADAGEISHEQFVRSAVQCMAECTDEIILVLDDYHVVSHEVQAVTQQLLGDAPLTFHLVVLSRTTPPLKPRPLLSGSEALCIDASEMRFDHEEFTAFIRREDAAELEERHYAAIERRAEGWIAGLHMLVQAGNAQLDNYADAAVLRSLPADLRHFLVDAAPLPYLTADLCAAATRRAPEECRRFIRQAADTIVLTTLFHQNGAADLLRIHPLLRDVLLRERASRSDVTNEQELRRRAAYAIAAQGEVDTALQIISRDDVSGIAELLAHALRPALMRYELASARRWLALLPPAMIVESPQIAVDAAWLEYFGETPQLRAATVRAAQALVSVPPSETTAELNAEVGVLEVLCTFVEGAHDRARAAADILRDRPRDPNGLAAGYLRLFEGYVPHDPSDADARIHNMQRAAEIFRRTGHRHGMIEAVVTQAYIKRRYANAEGTISGLTHALSFMHATGWEHSLFATDAAHACGEVLYLADRIADARSMLRRALTTARRHGAVPAIAYMAQVCLQLCDISDGNAEPIDAVEDAQRWAHILTSSTMTSIGSAGMLRLLRDHRLGHRESCRQTIESIGATPADLTIEMPDVIWYTVLAGNVFCGRTDAILEARLLNFRERMVAAHNDWMRLRSEVLHILLMLSHGRNEDARAQLLRLLPDIQRSGMPRLVTDHDALLPLLSCAPQPFAQRLAVHHADPSRPIRPYGLTRQELQIAQMLVAGRTREQIANELFISRFTIRAHLRNLYRKFGVHSRADAVRVAQAVGIKGE